MPKLKWTTHADLAIRKTPTVGRREYLDHMTFQRNDRPLFTEIFGPLIGLKEEWEAQGATADELDFSAFPYRCESRGYLPVNTGLNGGIDKHVLRRSRAEIAAELEYKILPMVRTGGCVLALDHRIPNGTPLENYRFYIKTAWEIMNRESAVSHATAT